MARESFGFREDRVDGDARDGDPALRHAEGHQVDLRLLEGHEVMLAIPAKPHGVNVEVGHDHGVQDVHSPSPLSQEMISDGRKCVQMATSG